MRKLKKLIVPFIVIGMLAAGVASFAATTSTPAGILSNLTGKSEDTLYQERADGKTFGEIANEAEVLDEFQAQMLEQRKAYLDQLVKDGRLTQAQADGILNTMKDRMAACDGTGMGGACGGLGLGRGNAGAGGRGVGRGSGMGYGNGAGFGCGMRGGPGR